MEGKISSIWVDLITDWIVSTWQLFCHIADTWQSSPISPWAFWHTSNEQQDKEEKWKTNLWVRHIFVYGESFIRSVYKEEVDYFVSEEWILLSDSIDFSYNYM